MTPYGQGARTPQGGKGPKGPKRAKGPKGQGAQEGDAQNDFLRHLFPRGLNDEGGMEADNTFRQQ